MPKFYVVYTDKPFGDGYAGGGVIRTRDLPGLHSTRPAMKDEAIEEARRLLVSGEAAEASLYEEGEDEKPAMDPVALRRHLGLGESRG